MEVLRTEHREILNMLLTVGRVGGIWSAVDPPLFIQRFLYSIYGFLAKGSLWTLAATMSADIISNSDDMFAMSDAGAMLAGLSAVIAKVVVFQRHPKDIRRLIDMVYGPIDTMVMAKDGPVYGLMNFHVNVEKVIEYGWAGMAVQLVGAMLVSPVIFAGGNSSLPLRSKYPFDTTDDLKHNMALGLQIITAIFNFTAMFALDGLMRGFCRWTSFQMQILNSNFRHCDPVYSRSNQESSAGKLTYMSNFESKINCFVLFHPTEITRESDSFLRRFETCIKHHQRIIVIMKDMNRVFGYYIFAEFSSSTFIMCLTGFQILLGKRSTTNVIKFMLYFNAAFVHLATCCFFGQMLSNEGNKIADSVWMSGWEKESNMSHAGYLMIIALMRAKQIIELKALGFYAVSMETFLMIVKSSYSVFALLTATTDETVE
ncbi:putative odorant receptor 85e [Diachasma alloeum]|uniref:Odorant receptor n=1 Tax=Diachasma alloeum TaxID=454923 RepID=A0A4E0RSM0_9HYME|nr:putative odorant receptor 85e [Diachasma alloeum]THK32927.1 odorant receptor 123 [Diachasma alloeum]